MSTVPPADGPEQPPLSDEQWAAFLRDAVEGSGAGAPKEPSARARTRLRRVRTAMRRGFRRPARLSVRAGLQAVVPWLAVAAVVVYGAWEQGLLSWGGGDESGPARAVALPGGGVSDGDHCGARGYHHFPLPPDASAPAPRSASAQHGPQLVLGSYGYVKPSRRTPGRLTVGLLFAPGSDGPLKLSRTLGGEGAAVEIEGPDGLVGGAHGLPVTWATPAKPGDAGTARIDLADGGGAELSLPPQALCPGYDATSVAEHLPPPADSSRTITGQPSYTLTVSVRDPGVGALRTSLGLPSAGGPAANVLSANNLVPDVP
ncbi:hypothetical protein [Streptomyces cyanogenus]|uniref:Uncharacterized protein n=1 Tax=Streptomyces cyanogenus TaxID=80860 RepID=A0ABX7TY05_STRCY|nr:hypothetical protein [Streptomyces cyanogenus]QTE00292.1 hypothetical protein S1361_23375 [Streptomyces cyanogenus]